MSCCATPKLFIVPTQLSEKRTAPGQRLRQDLRPSLLDEHVSKMRTLSPKALLAALNPSSVFEAVAIFAEGLVLNDGGESGPSEINGVDNSVVPERRGQISARFNEKMALPLSDV